MGIHLKKALQKSMKKLRMVVNLVNLISDLGSSTMYTAGVSTLQFAQFILFLKIIFANVDVGHLASWVAKMSQHCNSLQTHSFKINVG